ncbi:U3 small nucleolar RNA-associated protein 19 [Kwoniella heveanensis CBS 569]|nr:U3 small nucleolar RNA-associated protein 19 [Kwoniella heveanensis CBS 569]
MVSSLAKTKTKAKVPKSAASSSATSASSPLAQIAKLESSLIEGPYDPNPLLPLLSLARNDSPQIVHKAVWSLHRVFIKLIGDGRVGGLNGDLTVRNSRDVQNNGETGVGEVEGDEEREVRSWVRERLLEYMDILGGLVRDSEPALRSSSVPLLFSLLPPLSTSASTSTPLIHTPYFRLLLHYLYNPSSSLRGAKPKNNGAGWKVVAANQVEDEQGVLPSDVAKIVVDDFWAKYDDIRWAFFKESANLLQATPGSVAEPTNLLSQLLPLTNLPKLAEDINAFYVPSFSVPPSGNKKPKKAAGLKKGKGKTRYTGEVDALPDWMAEYESSGSEDESDDDAAATANGKKGSKKRPRQRTSQMSVHASVYSVMSHTTWYTTLWENVLSSLKIDDLWIRKILIGLHGDQGILGHFKPERRLRIADWLGSLVDGGGALAMLAMNGLFVLITQYNFEYPHFYDRLYGLLDRNVMHVKYRARFFRLLDMFLSSSLISSALIASFIKRLSRLALTAPPSGVILIIPFIYNLFKRHPGCMVMLQRPSSSIYTPPVLALSSSTAPTTINGSSSPEAEADPYDPEEKSVLKTRALESSCWELAALQKHYLAPIATLAKIFGEVFTKPEFNMEDFLDHGYGTLFETEANRRIKNPPALSLALDMQDKSQPQDSLDLFPSTTSTTAGAGAGAEGAEEEKIGAQVDVVNALWVF